MWTPPEDSGVTINDFDADELRGEQGVFLCDRFSRKVQDCRAQHMVRDFWLALL